MYTASGKSGRQNTKKLKKLVPKLEKLKLELRP